MKRKTSEAAVLYLLLVVFGALFLFPALWMLSTSLKSYEQAFQFPPSLLPNPPDFATYAELVTALPFLRYTGNTVLVTALSLVGYLASSALVAFGFSYFRFRGKEATFRVLLATMMIPPQVIIIPQFILFKRLEWIGSFKPLVIPAFFGSAFSIFLLRQFYDTVPRELSEAARIDGAAERWILGSIYLPLSRAALATAALFTFLWTWTDFLFPLIYLNDERMYTLSIGLQQLSTSRMTAWPHLMAGSVLMTLPIVVLFFLAQKTFVSGAVMSGIKG